MSQVFISYSRKDKVFVAKLQEALAGQKRDTWVDWNNIRPDGCEGSPILAEELRD